MDSYPSVEVIDPGGWTRGFPLSKKLIYVGSQPGNDVVLDPGRGTAVAPRHLQVIAAHGERAECRVLNLSSTEISFTPRSEATGISSVPKSRILPPRSALIIADGDRLQVAGFSLIFHLGREDWEGLPIVTPVADMAPRVSYEVPGNGATGADIGLELSLPQTTLGLEDPIEGTVTVRNLGTKPGVQFRLALEGLDPGCCEIGPGPILFPSAGRDVFVRLRHPRKQTPRAGEHRIVVRATAPEAYPGQSAVASKMIEVAPFYRHELRFVSTYGAVLPTP